MFNKSISRKIAGALILALIVSTLIVRILGRTQVCERSISVMGTVLTVKISQTPRENAEAAFDKAFTEALRIESVFSRRIDSSQIARVNEQAFNNWVDVSKEVIDLIKFAREVDMKTSGGLDVTVLPLINVWAKAAKVGKLPSPEEIENAQALVGTDKIIIDEEANRVRFKIAGMGLDLGAIVKGYAVDRMSEILRLQGCENNLVAAAGDIKVSAGGKNCKAWKIAVRHPRKKNEVIGTLSLENGAVSTSGDYERFFLYEEKRYHHLINPLTGYPAEGIVSITVIAPTAVEADAYATGLFIMGPEKAAEFLKNNDRLEGIIVTEENSKLSIREYLKKTRFEIA